MNLQNIDVNNDNMDFSNLNEWLPLEAIAQRYEQYSIGQLKHWANDRNQNGLDKVCKRVGKRLYIYESGFVLWIKNKKDCKAENKENSKEKRKKYMREYSKTAKPNLISIVEEFYNQDDDLTDDDISDLIN